MTAGVHSFRGRLVVGSVLWTLGVLLTTSVALVLFLATHPQPHATIFAWFIAVPLAASGVVGTLCLAAGALTIWRGLRSVDQVRVALADVHRGTCGRVSGVFPTEIQPLVDDLNALLAARDQRIARASSRAADVAHGLKTPLSVLAREAERVAVHDADLAANLATQVARMSRQIDHHLSQARVAAAGTMAGVSTPLGPALDGLLRALGRLHADRGLSFERQGDDDHRVRCAPEDLDEMLGNLLDNACTWGRTRVSVSSAHADGVVTVDVDDDGEGIEPSLMPRVLQRGVRADQRVPGSGLGLAIVHDLAELYGGRLTLERSPLGGLRARLTLPPADA